MEFQFEVNSLLPEVISKIDSSLKINGKRIATVDIKEFKSQILEIIDDIGIASAKAQELQTPVTSPEKFLSSEHIIYLMKDKDGNKGRGAVIGILKIGHKKLFLLDLHGNQNELTPKCVLDFYIHESQQRKGLGKIMFDFMLKNENLKPQNLAIDRPSPKFLLFLRKHYNLHEVIPQVNHFTIFVEFFSFSPSSSKETHSTAIPCQHPQRRNSLNFGSLPEEKGAWFLTEVAVRKSSKTNCRASFPLGSSNTGSALKSMEESYSQPWSSQFSSQTLTKKPKQSAKNTGEIKTTTIDHKDSNYTFDDTEDYGFGITSIASDRRNSTDLTGQSQQCDSSFNIFGVPASWTQPSCSVKTRHPVQP